MHAPRTPALVTLLTALLVGTSAWTSPAGAAPDRGTFHEESDVIRDCGDGLVLALHTVNDGRFLGVQHGDGLWYYSELVDLVATVTNPATGASLTVTNRGLVSKDQTITDNGDGTFTLRALSSARVAAYGPDGHLVSQSAGVVTYVFLIDNGGTPGDPTDDELLAYLGAEDAHGHLDGVGSCDLAAQYLA